MAAREALLEKEMEKPEALQVLTGFQQLLSHSLKCTERG